MKLKQFLNLTNETNKESNKAHQKIYLNFLINDPRNPIFTTNLQSKIIPMIAIQIRNTYPLIKPLVSALENFVGDFEIPGLNHSTFVSINIL